MGETAEEMFFTTLLEGHDPDYLGGTTFQRLDELQDKPQEGEGIVKVRMDGTVQKHTQTIKHWAGSIPVVDNEGKVIKRTPAGYVDIDFEGGQYIGQVDEDGVPHGEGKKINPDGKEFDGSWFKGE